MLIRLEDLENRARAACLDFGGPVAPESLRMLCCDAAVIPIVMNGSGQRNQSGPRLACGCVGAGVRSLIMLDSAGVRAAGDALV